MRAVRRSAGDAGENPVDLEDCPGRLVDEGRSKSDEPEASLIQIADH